MRSLACVCPCAVFCSIRRRIGMGFQAWWSAQECSPSRVRNHYSETGRKLYKCCEPFIADRYFISAVYAWFAIGDANERNFFKHLKYACMIPNGESIKLSELFSSAFAWSILCFKSSRQWQKFIESLLLLKYNWKFDAQSSDIQYIHLFCSSIQLRYIARGSQGKYPYEKFLVRPGIDPVIVSWITIQLWLWSPYY